MEIFVKAKQLLHIFGYSLTRGSISHTDIIRRFTCATIVMRLILSTYWFIAFKAEKFAEIAIPTLMLFNAIIIQLLCLLFFSRTARMIDLFDHFDGIIQSRMY